MLGWPYQQTEGVGQIVDDFRPDVEGPVMAALSPTAIGSERLRGHLLRREADVQASILSPPNHRFASAFSICTTCSAKVGARSAKWLSADAARWAI
jgi:hypothetical protein